MILENFFEDNSYIENGFMDSPVKEDENEEEILNYSRLYAERDFYFD